MARESKDERFERVTRVVFSELLRGGPDALQYANLARTAGVSRAWLYLYFGANKDALLSYTARMLGGAFTAFDVPSGPPTADGLRATVADGTRKALADIASTPGTMLLYFRYRNEPDPLGAEIRELERRYIDQFVAITPRHIPPDEARRFAELQMSMRTGLYYRWVDPDFRNTHSVGYVVAEVLSVIDGFLARYPA
jgi:AcrR family transcriptional regulator